MTNTTNTVIINEIPVDPTDSTKTGWGASLASQYYFAIANGTNAAETFDAADISGATKTLMASYGRGVSVNMGAGDDTVIGSAYGDSINAGAGINKIDGGANLNAASGERARDMLNVFAADQTAANALTVTAIASNATGADGDAYAAGYTIKVSNGTETDYLKNIEQVNVFVASGTSSYNYARTIRLAVDVNEVTAAQAPSSMHEAWVNGTDFADTFNAATDISSATQTLMANNGRGVWVDTGAGDDTITGSGYGDDISAGTGVNHVDGGANAGSPPWGGNATDVLHVTVATQAAANAVQVVQLSAASTGVDAAAFTTGYTFKIEAGAETDYVKGIERVSVQVATSDGGSTWVRDIALAVVVREADLSDTTANYYHLAWVNGTASADTIDASDNTLLSAATKAAMAARGRGVWIDGGDGNDTITGSAYADNIRNGAGNARIDGGANAGPAGQKGMDVFEISVASTAEMAAVTVTASDDPDYQYMVTYGSGSTQKDYLKNIEAITVNVTGTSTGKWIPLAVSVNEIAATADLDKSLDYAWAQGTAMADTFDATTDVSAATSALMVQHQRGVWVDLGAGDDKVTGSGFGDDISVGSGTNFVDGGANAGSPPWGGNALDTLHVTVASQADANAVQVVALAAGMAGADGDAFTKGYTFKVSANGETDYIKGIERVSIQLDTGNGGSTWVRDIPLAVVVQEANMADPQNANLYHLAWINGTANADTIDASATGSLLSATAKAALDTNKRGVWIDGGDGNDTITGTAYSDNFRNGAGNDKIDGGTNISADGHGQDVFEISVADTAAMAAVSVAASDDPAYTWMVTYGAGSTQKDYLKNVEGVIVSVNGGTASKWVPLAISVYETAHPATEQVAYVQGTLGDDTFDPATGLSATALNNITTTKHGIYVDLGDGNDTVTGTAYGDDFNLGAGTNYADGGANGGTAPWGGPSSDALHVLVQSQAEIDAVQVTALTAGMAGADADAFTKGYTQKVVAAGQVDYIKGIEHVYVSSATAGTVTRDIALTVSVHEISPTDPNIGSYYNLAFVNGTEGADTIDANALLSDAVKTEMTNRKHGVWIDGGAGDDVITGTGYSDNFRNGAGNSKIDGGANDAAAGQKGQDVFEIAVGSSAELSAVRVVASDDPDYQWMVTYGSGSTQKDYLKNIEGVSVFVTGTSTGKWIPLALSVTEVAPASQLDSVMHYAYAQGTSQGDSFDAATDVSAATRALMTQHGRGVYVDLGAGDDVMTGSAYGDNFVPGSGTNYVDGGTNLGSPPGGGTARDSVDVFVANQAAADAVTVTQLTATMTGDDAAAYAAGYRVKVVNGTAEVDYLRNVETLNISIWNDKNGDGTRDYRAATDTANEVTLVRSIALSEIPNTAPTFAGAPAGVAVSDAGRDYGAQGGIVLASGKLLSLSWLSGNDNAELVYVLARSNADGSVDTSFGGGTGRVVVPTSFDRGVTPVELPNGKLLVGVTTYGSTSDFKVMRLNADGSVDASFGTNGSTVVSVGGDDVLSQMAVDPNGKIVMVGNAPAADGRPIAIVRLNADGSLDSSFNAGGTLTVSFGTGNHGANALALGADGKIVVGGVAAGTPPAAALVRVNTDGTLDTTFGTGGKLIMPLGTVGSQVTAVQVLSSGKILVGAQGRSTGPDTDPVLMRLNADSTLDTTFGTGGMVKPHPTALADTLTAMQVQADGKIVTLGLVGLDPSSLNSIVAISRYNADGSLDTGFGTGGTTKVSVHGVGDQMISLALSGGKIVAFGSTANDVQFDDTNMIIRLNGDGSPDATFGAANPSSLGGTVRMDGVHALPLDINVSIYDVELALRGNYGGAALTLARHGGANAADHFSGVDEVTIDGGVLKVAGIAIGTAIQSNGALSIAFDNNATQGLVNRALHGIGYTNATPGTVTIDWTFSDGNDGSQGGGGAKNATGSSTVQVGVLVTEVVRSQADPSVDTNRTPLTSRAFLGTVSGTAAGDTFDSATGFSSTVRGLMDTFKHGANIDMGAGDDTVTGTGYADLFTMGSGVNRIDGGGNATPIGSSYKYDALNVYVASTADANAAQVTALSSSATGADKAAFDAGYRAKVVSGAETDYLKNIQEVDFWTWNDANGNNVRESSETVFARSVALNLRTYETQVSATDPAKDANGNLLSSLSTFAFANGSILDDSFNAATDVSAAARALMTQYKRGVWMDAGAGNDKLVGSDYGDDFTSGSGINKIDGGANLGTDPNNNAARDVLQVYVASQAAADAVAVYKLTADLAGADGAAYAEGYRYKVSNGSVSTDYLVNVETVNVSIWNDKDGDGQRDYLGSADPKNEVSLVRSIDVSTITAPPATTPNTAPTFAAPPGMVASDGGYDFAPIGLVRTSGGKLLSLVLENLVSQGQNYTGGLERHNADGSIDTSFAGGGRVLLQVPFGQVVTAPVELADGKILWAVSTGAAGTADFKVVRLNADGSLDTTFGDHGNAIVSLSAGNDLPRALLVQPDGKIVVTGTVDAGTANADFGAVRLNADGSVDTGFHVNGTSVLAPTTGKDAATSAILQPDGKLLITGYAAGVAAGTTNPVVMRLNTDGTLDTSFGGTGKVFVSPSTGVATSIGLVQADGSIILAGDAPNTTNSIAIVKIKADGTFDTAFGTGGGTVIPNNGVDTHTIQMKVQADGKIVVAATAGNTVEVLRVNTNGSLDTSFGTGGIVKLAPHGILDRATGLVLDGNKIVVQIGASYDTDYSETTVLARLNTDGSLDTTFGGTPVSSVGGTVHGDGINGVPLDINAAIYDAELAARNDYAGSSLTLARHGGAVAEDQFYAQGEVSFTGGVLKVGGVAIGHMTFGAGTITLNFDTGATQGLVNRAMHGIAYANTSSAPPASVTVDWSFSDGNDGSQGSGGLMRTVASSDVSIGVVTSETVRAFTDPTKSADGGTLANITYLATVYSTVGGETIDASQVLSPTVRGLMDQYHHGAWFVTRGGGDTVTGTAYGDFFTLGKGVNYLDGGAGTDTLVLNVPDQATVDAAQVVKLEGSLSGADADAASKGYTHKVVAGTETDYLRNVEKLTVAAPGTTGPGYHRDIAVLMSVNELDTSTGGQKVAFVNGADDSELIDASDNSALLPDTVKAKMTSTGFGVVVDGHGGNDTIVGSSHGDIFINEPGNAHIDGGANTGPGGTPVQDIFQINVASAALAAAVTIAESDDPAYTWMVTYGAGTEKDYLKNVEAVSVGVINSSEGGRFIQLAPRVFAVAAADLNNAYVVANVNGADPGGHFSAADLPAAVRATMEQYHRGIWFTGQGGNDTITGSDYYDEFNAGKGINHVDGGGSGGNPPQGTSRGDVLHVTVSSAAEAAAVQVTQLVSGGTGADADAAALGYTYKVSAAGETDYLKGIELVTVEVRQADNSTQWDHDVQLAVAVNPYDLSPAESTGWSQVGEVSGTGWGDVIDASAGGTLLPASLQTEMAASKRGLTINGGGGNDTITGSAYPDTIVNGAGSDHIDGGTQLTNHAGWGDVFSINVGTAVERDAITVTLSDNADYQYKVTYGSGSTQVDYLKNVESVNVFSADGSAMRFIQLALSVTEVQGTVNPANYMAYAFANGSPLGETFNATTDVSAATQALMSHDGRGIYADMGAGNDTVIGSAWGDQIIAGTGVNYIDGGTNLGTSPGGSAAVDELQVYVADAATAAAVTVTALSGSSTGIDAEAWAAGYTYKLVAGAETDYVKNMERYTVQIWNDLDHDGQRDYGQTQNDPANEVTWVASHDFASGTPAAVTLVGVPVV